MKKHSFKDWMIAVRPWSFPASAMPVVVTLAYLFWMKEDINWANGIWALLNIVVFHAAGNTWSDYFDYKQGVDMKDTFGAKTLTDKMFTPKEIYRLSLVLLLAALAEVSDYCGVQASLCCISVWAVRRARFCIRR